MTPEHAPLDTRFPGTRHTLQVQLSECLAALDKCREQAGYFAWAEAVTDLEAERALADRLAHELRLFTGASTVRGALAAYRTARDPT